MKPTKLIAICLIPLSLLPLTLLQGCVAAVGTAATTGVAVAYDRRTAGTVLDDQGIELKAKMEIFNQKEISNQSNVNINSYNGLVLITGETPTEALKQQVGALVEAIPKVKLVKNELMIAAPSPLSSRSSDSWITSKVKGRMVRDEGVDPLHVRVVTERGTVYLMGLVTRKEAEDAVAVARTTSGVQRVVLVFEYLD